MTEQPEALRLAAVPIVDRSITWQSQATIELRRLSAENEALQNTKHYEAPRGFVLNPDYLVPELRAQRDALLEACKAYDQWADKTLCYDRELRPIRAQIRAAIKQAEGEKT